MKNDLRVALPQDHIDDALRQMVQADPTFAEMYVRKQEARRLHELATEKRLKYELENLRQMGLQNQAMQAAAGAYQYKTAQLQNFPNEQNCQNIAPGMFTGVMPAIMQSGPPPLDEESPRADQAQAEALAMMNPIARIEFEPVLRILGIKVRFTTTAHSVGAKQWILARMGKDGRMIRQEWTAP